MATDGLLGHLVERRDAVTFTDQHTTQSGVRGNAIAGQMRRKQDAAALHTKTRSLSIPRHQLGMANLPDHQLAQHLHVVLPKLELAVRWLPTPSQGFKRDA